MKATLDSHGRIQLPSEIQTQLGLHPGDNVVLEADNGQCVNPSMIAPILTQAVADATTPCPWRDHRIESSDCWALAKRVSHGSSYTSSGT